MNNILRRAISKAYDATKSYVGYTFNHDVGPSYIRNGVRFLKVSNGYGYRYVAQNPQDFPTTTYSMTISDAIAGAQNMFALEIPGGVMHEGDTLTFTFTFSGTPTTFNHTLNIDNTHILANVISRYNNSTSTSPVTVTFTMTMVDSCTLVVSSPGSYVKNNSNLAHPVNALGPITLRLSGTFSGTAIGRTMTVSDVSWTYTPAAAPAVVDPPYTGYRLPDQQPFRNDSFWNVPFDNSGSGTAPIFESASGPMSKVMIDKWAGQTTKSGNPTITQYASSYNNAWIPIVQIKESDPQQIWDFSINTATTPGYTYFGNYPVSLVNTSKKLYRFQSPPGPLTTGQVGDNVVLLITPDKRWCIEVGHYSYNATTKVHKGNVRFIDLYGYGYTNKWHPMLSTNVLTSLLSSGGYGFQMNGFRASGFPLLAGLVRGWELNAGKIDHMMLMLLANVQMMATVFSVVSASGSTFVVTSNTKMTTPSAGGVTLTECDYTSILTAGKVIYYAGNTYTINGTPTYNSSNGRTTFTVSTTITGSDTTCNFGTTKYNSGTVGDFEYSIKWPATERDGYAAATANGYGLTIPMGQVFGIPPGVDVTALGLSAEGVIVARAFQKYGGIVADTSSYTNILCQTDATLTTTQQNNIRNDAPAIIAQLRAVTNWGPSLVSAAFNNAALQKPSPILPMYG